MPIVCINRPNRKVPRRWTPRDLARVAQHLRNSGIQETLIYAAIRAESDFKIDDSMRGFDPLARDLGLSTFKTIKGIIIILLTFLRIKFLRVWLIGAVSFIAGALNRELQIVRYVIEARQFSGGPSIDEKAALKELEDELDEINSILKKSEFFIP